MTEKFNDDPFDRIHCILDRTEDTEPEVNKIGINRVDRDNRRHETIHNSINYIEQARRFLKGAEAHDSRRAYQMGDDSLDDLQQNLQILVVPYPDQVSEIRDHIPELWEEKRRVYDNLSVDPDGIAERDYNQVLLDLRSDDVLKLTEEEPSPMFESPNYRPTYWTD